MPTLSLKIRYRPVRIGWCVREGNLDHFQTAIRMSSCLWGGRSNPIIPVNDAEAAAKLISTFRADVLCAVGDDPMLQTFVQSLSYLPWPEFEQGVFVAGKEPQFLDIYHPIRHFYEEHVKGQQVVVGVAMPASFAVLHSWSNDDPLGPVLLATFGSYPEELKLNYRRLMEEYLHAASINIGATGPIPPNALEFPSPIEISRYELNWDRSPGRFMPGLYLGSVSDLGRSRQLLESPCS
jgi:hypothetical protein